MIPHTPSWPISHCDNGNPEAWVLQSAPTPVPLAIDTPIYERTTHYRSASLLPYGDMGHPRSWPDRKRHWGHFRRTDSQPNVIPSRTTYCNHDWSEIIGNLPLPLPASVSENLHEFVRVQHHARVTE